MTLIKYRLALAARGTSGLGTPIISDVFSATGTPRSNQEPIRFTETLNSWGSLEFELPADHASVTQATFSTGKELHLYRDAGAGEVLVWGGHLWVADVEWPFVRFLGYGWFYDLTRRCVANKVDRLVYKDVDQFDIVRDLVDRTQAQDPLGITHYDLLDSGVLKDLEVCEEERKLVADAITDFTDEQNGLDFNISPAKVLRLYSPKRGTTKAITFDAASNVAHLSYQIDGTTINTQAAAVGEDECGPYVEYFEDAAGIAAYGVLNGHVEGGGPKKKRVREKAKELLRTTKTPRFQPSVFSFTDLTGAPAITTYEVGDVISVAASQGPAGGFGRLAQTFRITERQVAVQNPGVENVTLVLDSVTA